MLNPSDYNNQKLDQETRNQLFRLFVENKIKEFESYGQKLVALEEKIRALDAVFHNINARLDKHMDESLQDHLTIYKSIKSIWDNMGEKKFNFWSWFKKK